MIGRKGVRRLWTGAGILAASGVVAIFVLIPAKNGGMASPTSSVPSISPLTTIPPRGEASSPTTWIPGGRPAQPPPALPPAPPTQMLMHEAAPTVPIPATPCVDSELTAQISVEGPYLGMGKIEQIVSVESSVPCFVDGYPTITFAGADAQISDGGAVGNYPSAAPVALGPGVAASFMFEMFDMVSCQPASGMYFGVPSTTPEKPISLDLPGNPSWVLCRGGISVTPFEQGDSVDNYA